MKPVMISVLLFSILLSRATALKCYQCTERNSGTCEHELKECPEGERCITTSEEFEFNGTYHSIYKGCSGDLPCDTKLNSNANRGLSLLFYRKCCDEDGCNSKFYEMPEEEANGVMCPSCFELDTVEECESDKEMMCHAKDDKCVTFSGTIEKPDGEEVTYSLKGCISSIGCTMDLSTLIGVKVLNAALFKCSPPPGEE